jgi:hypothetical protein
MMISLEAECKGEQNENDTKHSLVAGVLLIVLFFGSHFCSPSSVDVAIIPH